MGDVAESADPDAVNLGTLRLTVADGADDVGDEELAGFWRFALGRLVLAALRREGWTVETVPGQPLRCRRDGDTLEPYTELERALAGERGPHRWRERCIGLGIAGVALVPAPPPAPVDDVY